MKIIIFSDLHANWEALSALQRAESQPDAVLFLGDVVNFGPDPKRCLDWVRGQRHGRRARQPRPRASPSAASGRQPGLAGRVYRVMRDYTQSVLTAEDRAWLGEPAVEPDRRAGRQALPPGPRDAQRAAGACALSLVTARQEDLEAELALLDPRPDVLLVGHTHLPGMRKVGDTIIVNPGSLGQPRNGIPDATYAVWRDGDLQIHHLHYDHDTTQRKLMMLPLDPDVVDRLQEILETGSA